MANLVLMRKFVIRMMEVRENISLLGMNSFGFDVSARRLVEFASAEDLRQAFETMCFSLPITAARCSILSTGA